MASLMFVREHLEARTLPIPLDRGYRGDWGYIKLEYAPAPADKTGPHLSRISTILIGGGLIEPRRVPGVARMLGVPFVLDLGIVALAFAFSAAVGGYASARRAWTHRGPAPGKRTGTGRQRATS